MGYKREVLVCASVFVMLFLASISIAAPEIDTSSLILKVVGKEGTPINRGISVSSEDGGQFFLEVQGITGVTLSETSMTLDPNEVREVGVKLSSDSLGKGVHVGSIRITSGEDVQAIPIIFEVESRDVFFDINLDIPLQYIEIKPGERFVAQLKVFDLTWGGTQEGLGPTNVDIDYSVYSLDGTMISSETETIVVNRQAQITKNFNFPSTTKEGDYVFVATAKYSGSLGSSTGLFTISRSAGGGLFGDLNLGSVFGVFNNGLVILIVVLGIFFLMIVALFVYMIKDRDKLLSEMRRYNSQELKMQKQFLMVQQKMLTRKEPARRSEIGKEVKEKLVRLKQKQRSRIVEIKKLKKAGNLKQMKSRVIEWKKKGYNVLPLEYKLKGLSTGEMKSLLAKWKRQYKH
jgi:hypothetical protein